MSAAGSFDRATALARLADQTYDLLIIGGGITGAGVALDAASRGLRTALVERGDFAEGTSSKSSKLVHGGLRYLQQGEIRLVYQALAERQRLRRNAPHLVSVQPFLIPIFAKGGLIPRRLAWTLGIAMWMYDLTGGLRIGRLHKKVSRDEAYAYMPTLREGRVAGGYVYYDARADDARLTTTLLRTAALNHGAVVANRADVTELVHDDESRTVGARVNADGQTIEVSARAIVNATGVWADEVRQLDEGTDPDSIRPAKGIHVTVPWSLVQNKIAAVVPARSDKRSVFVVRWGDLTYIGTTDTDYEGSLDDPQCTPEDVDYLLTAINQAIEGEITTGDVVGTWAGLRPLVSDASDEKTADLSRHHKVHRAPGDMVTVTGGKLTTYRRMAADAVDEVVDVLGGGFPRRSRTKKLALRGARDYDDATRATVASLSAESVTRLAERYGGEAYILFAMIERDPDLAETLVAGLPYVRAEALYAARYEMATTLDDVLARRTRARLLARDASAAAAEDVARLIAPDLGWSATDIDTQVTNYRERVTAERTAAGLPPPVPAAAAN